MKGETKGDAAQFVTICAAFPVARVMSIAGRHRLRIPEPIMSILQHAELTVGCFCWVRYRRVSTSRAAAGFGQSLGSGRRRGCEKATLPGGEEEVERESTLIHANRDSSFVVVSPTWCLGVIGD
jgi:hypothetical protein